MRLVPLGFAVIGIVVIAGAVGARSGPRHVTITDGRVRISRRGVHGTEVAIFGAFALVFLPAGIGVALAGAGWMSIPFVLVGLGFAGAFVYKACAFLTRVSAVVDRVEARRGDVLKVQHAVASPLPPHNVIASLIGRERVVYSDGEDQD